MDSLPGRRHLDGAGGARPGQHRLCLHSLFPHSRHGRRHQRSPGHLPGADHRPAARHADPRRAHLPHGAGRHGADFRRARRHRRSEEHTSELQSLMRISSAVFCLRKKILLIVTALDMRLYTNPHATYWVISFMTVYKALTNMTSTTSKPTTKIT